MNDLEKLLTMFTNADIEFSMENDVHGWAKVLKMGGDRMFVFTKDNEMAGIRSHDDSKSYDSRHD